MRSRRLLAAAFSLLVAGTTGAGASTPRDAVRDFEVYAGLLADLDW